MLPTANVDIENLYGSLVQTSMNVVQVHVAMEEHVQIRSINITAAVTLDTQDFTVKQVQYVFSNVMQCLLLDVTNCAKGGLVVRTLFEQAVQC